MSAFDTSVGGLMAQAAAIQVTSSNVANASTVGYKARTSLFVDQYFRAVHAGGVSSSADAGTRRDETQGALKSSNSSLDLAVQGQGLFRLTNQSSGDAASTFYTRNGSFSADKNGYIVNANGLFLTGYTADAAMTGTTSTIGALKLPPPNVAPLASSAGTVVANLDIRQAEPVVTQGGVATATPKIFRASDPATYNASTTVEVYDSRGQSHQISLFFKKVDSTEVADPRSLVVPAANATATQYEVYMQADGVTMSRANVGNTGEATLGAEAAAAAVAADKLADEYTAKMAVAEAKTSQYNAAVAASKAADVAAAAGASEPVAAVVAARKALAAAEAKSPVVDAEVAEAKSAVATALDGAKGASSPLEQTWLVTWGAEEPALVAKLAADKEALAADAANRAAVETTRVGTLQFIDGRLVGSLTSAGAGGSATVPTSFGAHLRDAQGNPLVDVALDLSGMTAYSAGFQITTNQADGYPPGALTGVSVAETGLVTGQYSNGKALVAGQLVLANFASEAGLSAASGTVFEESIASGSATLGTGTTGSFGAIRAQMLEQSTTDMAAELVNLMILQRNYQANSQGLQAANTLLTTAINMGR